MPGLYPVAVLGTADWTQANLCRESAASRRELPFAPVTTAGEGNGKKYLLLQSYAHPGPKFKTENAYHRQVNVFACLPERVPLADQEPWSSQVARENVESDRG